MKPQTNSHTPIACALLAILLGVLSLPHLSLERASNETNSPILTASISSPKTDNYEFSAQTKDNLLPKLNSIPGVSSVNATGLIEKQLLISINQPQLDAANHALLQSIDYKFAELESELTSDEQKLLDAMQKLEQDGERSRRMITDMLAQLQQGQSQLPGTTLQLETERTEAQASLDQLRASVAQQETDLANASAPNEFTREQAEALKTFDQNLSLMRNQKQTLLTQPADVAAARISQVDAAIEALERNPLYISLENRQRRLDEYASAQANLEADRANISACENQIARLGTMLEKLRSGILPSGIVQGIDEDIPLQESLERLQTQSARLDEQLAIVAQQIAAGQEVLGAERESFEQRREELLQNAGMADKLTLENAWALVASYCTGLPEGQISADGLSYVITASEPYSDAGVMGDMLLIPAGANGQGEIRLKDLATLTPTDSSTGEGTEKGKVTLKFWLSPGHSTMETVRQIKQTLDSMQAADSGLIIELTQDAGDALEAMRNASLNKLLFSAGLVVLMLMVLLWNLAAAFIAAAVMPVSLAVALIVMRFSGIALTEATMNALIVGTVLSVICPVLALETVENERVNGVLVAATAAMLAVMVPVWFVWGPGQLVAEKQAGLVAAILLTASLGASVTLVPALAGKWVRRRTSARLQRWYGQMLAGALRMRALAAVIFLVATGCVWWLSGRMGTLVDAGRWAMMGGLILLVVYLAMLSGLQSAWKPLLALTAVPAAMTGGLLALVLCGMSWSQPALLGLGTLPGLTAIGGMWFLTKIGTTKDAQAARQAGKEILNPVVVLSLSVIIGLLGWLIPSSKAEPAMPTIIAMLGGMLGAIIGNLLVLPGIYGILYRTKSRVKTKDSLRPPTEA